MAIIRAAQIEYEEGGNTIWIHGPEGGTVLRLKTFTGKITTQPCAGSPIPHADAVLTGDVVFCVPRRGRR